MQKWPYWGVGLLLAALIGCADIKSRPPKGEPPPPTNTKVFRVQLPARGESIPAPQEETAEETISAPQEEELK